MPGGPRGPGPTGNGHTGELRGHPLGDHVPQDGGRSRPSGTSVGVGPGHRGGPPRRGLRGARARVPGHAGRLPPRDAGPYWPTTSWRGSAGRGSTPSCSPTAASATRRRRRPSLPRRAVAACPLPCPRSSPYGRTSEPSSSGTRPGRTLSAVLRDESVPERERVRYAELLGRLLADVHATPLGDAPRWDAEDELTALEALLAPTSHADPAIGRSLAALVDRLADNVPEDTDPVFSHGAFRTGQVVSPRRQAVAARPRHGERLRPGA